MFVEIPSRFFDVLRHIREKGIIQVGNIAEKFGFDKKTVTENIQVLRDLELIEYIDPDSSEILELQGHQEKILVRITGKGILVDEGKLKLSNSVVSIGERVLTTIRDWNPSCNFEREREYRDELFLYLCDKFPNEQVKKERLHVDISVSKRVAIEIKKDLYTKSEVDRLKGQILGYFDEDYPYVIIVICGKSSETVKRSLRIQVRELDTNVKNRTPLSVLDFVELVDKTVL